jgi:hypothetical protein
MPDSMGKRKRRDVTARKHAAREERRVARAGRKKDREAGIIEPGPPIGPAEQSEFLVLEPEGDGEAATEGEGSEPKAAAASKSAVAPTAPEPKPAESDARGEPKG